ISQGTFDTYSRVDGTKNFVFDNLATGTHTIEIRAIDQANPLSSDDYIYLDYIDVWDGTPMLDGTFDAILEPYDGDERIYRSGGWGTRTAAAAISGTFLRDGTSAWFHVVGDSVSFNYLSDSSIGLMEVWIDGVSQGIFDLYSPTSLAGALSFDGLGSGPHVIQIRNYRGRATIDGFTTPGTAPFYTPPVQTGVVRYEDFDPALLYNGVPLRQSTTGWVSSGFSLASRNYVLGTNIGGNSVSLTFDGEWVNVGFLTRSRSGLAEIFIDGVSQGTFDTYSRVDGTTNFVFDNLAPGSHSIEIRATDLANPLSSDDYLYLDYIDVWDGTPMPDGTFDAILEPYDGDERIYRSGGWGTRTNAAAINGTFLRDGTSAWFHVVGESVSFNYLSDSSIGEMEIWIDGVSQGQFNLYNPTSLAGALSFDGLGSGPHVIQARSFRGRATVDGFTSPGTAPFYTPPIKTGIVRYEDQDPAILYNGLPFRQTSPSWQNSSFSVASRSYVRGTNVGGNNATLTFDGEWVNVGFLTRSRAGLAEILIDGVSQGTFDTYSPADSTINVVFDSLGPGSHTIEIRATDQANPSSSDDYVYIDYIDVWDGTPMPTGSFEAILEPYNGDERIWRSGGWGTINSAAASDGTYLRDGFSVWFPFTGSSVNFDGFVYSGAGVVEVLIDGVSQGEVVLTNPDTFNRPFAYVNLSDGPHVLQVRRVSGRATVDGFTTPGSLFRFEPSNAELSASIGAPNTFPINVTNFGDITDTFDITITSDSWPVTINPEALTLEPGASAVVNATVIVPPTANLLDTNRISVTVTAPNQGGFASVNLLDVFAVDVASQLCLAIDASGSVSGGDFELAKAGLAAALRDPNTVPRDGSVEISVIQFPLGANVVELAPVVIVSDATAEAAAQQIEAIVKAGGGTPMEDGVRVCKDLIVNSTHFTSAENHIINLATDGAPNNGTETLNQRQLAIDAGINQINSEAIGSANIAFLRDQLVYPQPGYLAPPFNDSGSGFVIPISTFEEFAESIKQKLQFVLGIYNVEVAHTIPMTGTAILSDTIDPAAAAIISDTVRSQIDWKYTLAGDGDQQVLTLQTLLPNMQPGETRIVAEGTVISYTAPSGESTSLTLPPLAVAAPHLIALEPPTQTVGTGASAVYSATLSNFTDDPLDLTLSVVGLPSGWVSGDGLYTVPSNDSLVVPLSISVPDNAAFGSYPFTALVDTATGGQDQASAQLDIVDGFNISVSPQVQTADVNTVVSYTISIDNPLPTEETYQLALNGLDAATAANLPPSITVPGGGSATLELPVVAAFPEGLDPFTVVATDSQGVMDSDEALLRIEGATGVSLALNPTSAVGGPGTGSTFEVTISNLGDFIDTYDLDVLLPTGWTSEWLASGQVVDPITLTPAVFNASTVVLLITPPAGTAPGGYPFTVSADSTLYPSATASVDGAVEVLGQGVNVEITPASTTIDPSAPAVWDITVTNAGSGSDTFDLSTLGLGGEGGQFSSNAVSLGAGQSAMVQLTIDAPDVLLTNTVYQLQVEARSQTDSRISDTDIANVEIGPVEGVIIEWLEENQTVDAGGSIDYFLTVTNTGNVEQTFNLSLLPSGGNGDNVSLAAELTSLDIPAGFSGVVRVTAETAAPADGVFTLEGTAANGPVSDSDSATLIVNPVDTVPVAVDDTASTLEETPVLIDVLGNDSDADGDSLSIDSFTQPFGGTVAISVTLLGDPAIVFTPTLDFSGVTTFTYSATDGTNPSNLALVTVTVTDVNEPPAAVDDTATTPEDTPVNIDVLDNDSDPEGGALFVVSTTAPQNGVVAVNPDNTLTYTPTLGYIGPDSFEYTISDGMGGEDTATVNVTVFLPQAFLNGVVDLQARSDDTIDLELNLYALDDAVNPLFTFDTTTNSQGEFSVSAVPPGDYQLALKAFIHLQTVEVRTLVDGSNTVDFGTQLVGDANGDNSVTLIDFSILADAFNTTVNDPNFQANADFDGNGAVTLVDFSFLATNFNTVGGEPTE
ncbi:MAG: Ig-like domain-containing protein, partial [Chloroflexota bacterium]